MGNEIITKEDARIKAFFKMITETWEHFTHMIENCKPTLNSEQFLTNKDVSKKLHISLRTLQQYRDTGLLPYIKLEGKILYKSSDIERLLENNYYPTFER